MNGVMPERRSWRALWQEALRFERQAALPAQMALLERNMPVALWGTALTAWVCATCLAWPLQQPVAYLWALWVSGVSAVGWWCGRHLNGQIPLREGALRYARLLRAVWVMQGVSWGALAWLFIQPAQPASTVLVLGTLGGLTSAGLAVLGASWPLSVAFWMSCTLTTASGLLRVDDPVHATLALGVLTYLGAMTVFSYHTARMAQRSIDLHRENERLVGQLRDQTRRAHEARQLAEEAGAQADAANRAKTVFLASVSHDLRQPLHAAGLYLSALTRMGWQGRAAYLLGQVEASQAAANDMLNTLMDFSRVDAGVVQARMTPFALQPVLHRLVQELAPWAEEKGLALRLRDTLCVVHADPALVEMVVRNLLLNAIRYTERGAVLLACRRRSGQAWIEVWDTGVGIPRHQQEAIFQEFHQLGNPERDQRKGLGLGLAIARGLVRAMNVALTVSSVPGRGSVFRLQLPLSTAPLTDVRTTDLPSSSSLQGLKVLLIDDDERVRQAMGELLSDWGCWCEVAESAESACGLLQRFEPDVIVCDHRLREGRSGVQAVEYLWSRLQRRVPSVLVTADTANERLREAHASGLLLLHKPVPAARLYEVLTRLGERQQASSTTG